MRDETKREKERRTLCPWTGNVYTPPTRQAERVCLDKTLQLVPIGVFELSSDVVPRDCEGLFGLEGTISFTRQPWGNSVPHRYLKRVTMVKFKSSESVMSNLVFLKPLPNNYASASPFLYYFNNVIETPHFFMKERKRMSGNVGNPCRKGLFQMELL